MTVAVLHRVMQDIKACPLTSGKFQSCALSFLSVPQGGVVLMEKGDRYLRMCKHTWIQRASKDLKRYRTKGDQTLPGEDSPGEHTSQNVS